MESVQKEQLQEVFNKIDVNQDGELEREEIQKLSLELNEELSESELNKIFQHMDVDQNGKISFTEFYDWWYHGKQNKLKPLVYAKMKAQKYHKKVSTYLNDKVGKFQSGPSEEYSSSSVNIQIGDEPIQTEASFSFFTGKESQESQKQNTQGLELQEGVFSLVLQIGVNDSSKAIEQFKEIFEQLQTLVVSFIPPEFGALVENNLKIVYSTPSPSLISIGFQVNHELINDTLANYINLYKEFISSEQGLSLQVSLGSSSSFEQLAQDQEKSALDIKCVKFSKNLQISTSSLKKLKSILYNQAEKMKNKSHKEKRKFSKKVILSLLESVNIQLKCNQVKDPLKLLQEIIGLNPDKQFSLSQLIQSLDSNDNSELQGFLSEVPIIEEIIKAFQDYGNSEIKICLNFIVFNCVFNFKTVGVAAIVETFLKILK